ncbi:ROK family protein [Streptomyces sp. NPDC053513]|uniref:ROK family protein n=1 Tax=unclassified Streptomyces TaxID=2593676 RepID=UPI0037D750B6
MLNGRTPPPSGAPDPAVEGAPPPCVLALDVGGTAMKGAVLDRAMQPVASLHRPTPCAEGPEAVVDAITDTLLRLAERASERDLSVLHAGVVVPGIVDERAQRAVWSANLGWRDLALGAVLEARTGMTVTLGHDVRAGGAAECALGAARAVRNALFVAVGTGVAAALVCDGRPLSCDGFAGELGHVRVHGGRTCACGGTGCLETVASASAVAHAYASRSGRRVTGAAEVAALVEGGDPVARTVWVTATEALAEALAAATTLFAPEVVVLGGGLAESDRLLLDPVRDGLAARLAFQRTPAVVRADLGDRAGCLGAGLAAWHAAGHRVPVLPTGASAR